MKILHDKIILAVNNNVRKKLEIIDRKNPENTFNEVRKLFKAKEPSSVNIIKISQDKEILLKNAGINTDDL